MSDISFNERDTLWTERYRPKKIEDCVLPTHLATQFKGIIEKGEMPNMLFSGGAGAGKTTAAKALCNELDMEWILINTSNERNIDVLRTTITGFASAASLNGNLKCVILDEFDYSNANTLQPALRSAMEELSRNCRFILTCNYPNRIIDAIHSRCASYKFEIPSAERPKLATKVFTRINSILDNEGVTYDKQSVAALVQKYFPDFRRMLNELQRYALVNGTIDENILKNSGGVKIDDFVQAMKEKSFKKTRQWIANNALEQDVNIIFRKIFDSMYDFVEPSSIPTLVLLIADYQYKGAIVADPEINLAAFSVAVMQEIEFK